MAELGLLAPVCSEEYGGSGMDWTMATIAAEELGRADISLAASMAKLKAPLVGFEVMIEVTDWFGAMAYTKECPVEMGIRGIRSYSIGAEGGMNILRIIIPRELLGAEFLPYRQ